MNPPSLAFTLVALSYLLGEADFHVRQLNLPCPPVLQRTNLTESRVAGRAERFLAYVTTTNYSFAFHEDGFLHRLAKRRPPDADAHIPEYHRFLAQQYSELDTNGAHQLATQRLAAVGVDVQRLEKTYPHQVTFPKLSKAVKVKHGSRTEKTEIVPRFWITWGKFGSPGLDPGAPYAAQVQLIGPTKELVELAVGVRSLSSRPPISVPGEGVLMNLPNEAFTNLWARPELSPTNVFGILRTSTAYQREMLGRMLAEANWAIQQLGLPPERRLVLANITNSCVVPPRFGFRGSIMGRGSYFEFDEQGKLVYLLVPSPSSIGKPSNTEFYEEMSHRPMLVDSNSVVELATNWLKSLRLDLDGLSRLDGPSIQRYKYARGKLSHLWWLAWHDPQSRKQVLWVEVDGTTRHPDRIRLSFPEFALRTGIVITNAAELMNIPDKMPQRHPLMAHLNVTD